MGMPYAQQVDRLEALLSRPPLDHLRPSMLVDYMEVGRPVFDMLASNAGLHRAQGVVITGGRETNGTLAGWPAPKAELVSKLHSGGLRIAASLSDTAVLARELQVFRVRYTETPGTRSSAHGKVSTMI